MIKATNFIEYLRTGEASKGGLVIRNLNLNGVFIVFYQLKI